jgi:di/tricarboxylate transporter
LFVVGALALGEGLQRTGVAEALADAMVGVARPLGTGSVVLALLLVGTVLNQFTSPYAVTVLLMPIALDAAAALGVADARAFVLAVVFAGSNAFASPLGHQVNLMVMGPGGYRASDFVRVGGALCVLYAVLVGGVLALSS